VLVEAAKAKAAARKVEAGKAHGRGQRNRSPSKDGKLSNKRSEAWYKDLASRMGVSQPVLVEAAKAAAAVRDATAKKKPRNRVVSFDTTLKKKRSEAWYKHLAARMGVSESTIYRMDLVLNKQPNETLKGAEIGRRKQG